MTNETLDKLQSKPRLHRLARAGRLGLTAIRKLNPPLYEFLAAKRPQVRLSFGRSELHLRRDGLVFIDREAATIDVPVEAAVVETAPPAVPFVPRQAGQQDSDGYLFRTPEEGYGDVDVSQPAALDTSSMEAEVKERMGERTDVEEGDLEIPEEMKNAESITAEVQRVRDLLQGLDDVEDHDLISDLNDELYQLYKAVDYKLKRHHSSEAKAELGKLFNM